MVAAIPKAGPFTTPEMEQIASCQPEMEFLKGIFEVSGQTRDLVWFSTLIFPFYKILFMNRLEFSCFADFFFGNDLQNERRL
jgi:hypothetical protein